MKGSTGFSRDALAAQGFSGFESVRSLRATRCASVTSEPGVYVVLRLSRGTPRFLTRSIGGHFKGRDPTARVQLLRDRWITGCETVYVGKAERSMLRTRVRLLVDYGGGKPVGHQGGRYLWQLPDSDRLVVAWRAEADPTKAENTLLNDFAEQYDNYPFANIAGPRG